jgi:hypothetical protein
MTTNEDPPPLVTRREEDPMEEEQGNNEVRRHPGEGLFGPGSFPVELRKFILRKVVEPLAALPLEPRDFLECEFRFGTFKNKGGFTPGIPREAHHNLLQFFINPINGFTTPWGKVPSRAVDTLYNLTLPGGQTRNLRETFNMSKGGVMTRIIKERFAGPYDDWSMGVRVGFALESRLDLVKGTKVPGVQRLKIRHGFSRKDKINETTGLSQPWPFVYHLTEVYTTEDMSLMDNGSFEQRCPVSYEFEVEIHRYYSRPSGWTAMLINTAFNELTAFREIIDKNPVPTDRKARHEALSAYCHIAKGHLDKSKWDMWKRNKFVGAQVVSLQAQDLKRLGLERWAVGDKTDGDRVLLFFHAGGVWMIHRTEGKLDFKPTDLIYPAEDKADLMETFSGTLLDGEYLPGKNTIVLFDTLWYGSVDVSKWGYDDRWDLLDSFVDRLNKCQWDPDTTHYRVVVKPVMFPENPMDVAGLAKEILDWFRENKEHALFDIDGLVFTRVAQELPGLGVRCDGMLKWKPPEMCSVDLWMLRPETVPFGTGTVCWHLFASCANAQQWEQGGGMGSDGLSRGLRSLIYLLGEDPGSKVLVEDLVAHAKRAVRGNWIPSLITTLQVPVSVSLQYPYNRQVVEFHPKGNTWVPGKIRWDKPRPNGINVVTSVLETIRNPVTEAMITTPQYHLPM